jgi:hypothetical protein
MGLDYRAPHLKEDCEKLIHSQVDHGYLVHFSRTGPDEVAEGVILDSGGNGHVKTAYACVAGNAVSYKLVNGDHIVNA